MSTIENAVIAVAGMGKRLAIGKPKCLIDIQGKKIIEYQLELLKCIKNVFVVVGFMEQDVIRFVKNIRSDVIFVRNPNFQNTKTLESFYLAARIIQDKAIFMDGDMIVDTKSFQSFMQQAACHDFLVAVSQRISDDPVYAKIQKKEKLILEGFSRMEKTAYEWANIVSLPSCKMKSGACDVFEHLETMLPATAAVIDRLEIDTPQDLEFARKEVWRIRL